MGLFDKSNMSKINILSGALKINNKITTGWTEPYFIMKITLIVSLYLMKNNIVKISVESLNTYSYSDWDVIIVHNIFRSIAI